jgi:ribose 5-phosphate isomerase B
MKHIYFAADHAGYQLKNILIEYAQSLGYSTEDLGPFIHDPEDDYPDYVSKVAQKVALHSEEARGCVLGGSGTGEALLSNKYPGVRAALWYGGPISIVSLSREHNNANILSLGARFITTQDAQEALKVFLETNFTYDARHERRLKKINQCEQEILLNNENTTHAI